MSEVHNYEERANIAMGVVKKGDTIAEQQVLVNIAQVYATLAVAGELRLARESQFACDHGYVGLCMFCLRDTIHASGAPA